jgi:hypothetical protein
MVPDRKRRLAGFSEDGHIDGSGFRVPVRFKVLGSVRGSRFQVRDPRRFEALGGVGLSIEELR